VRRRSKELLGNTLTACWALSPVLELVGHGGDGPMRRRPICAADAEEVLKIVRALRPEMKLHALHTLTQVFMASGKLDRPGTRPTHRKPEKTLDAHTPAAQQAAVLKAVPRRP